MTGRIFIDTFSSLDDVPKKLRGDDDTVFHALALAKRFSCFEASESATLASTIRRLEENGRIKTVPEQYPWTRVEIMEHKPTKGSENE